MISAIAKSEFDALGPARAPGIAALATEKAWFANSSKSVIGAILFDRSDKDWNYVILGRDERGSFRWIEGDSSFETETLAKQKLTAAMERIDKTGESVFPQGD